nr:hypothetical protein GCM10025732_57980 [Glycomyces mayteni]
MHGISRRIRPLIATLSALAFAAATAVAILIASPAQAQTCNGYVGLTFDDGPNPGTTSSLLNALTANGLRATMFNTGQRAASNPGLVAAQVSAGMWVGNHSYTHGHMTQMSSSQMAQEISSTQSAIQQGGGGTPSCSARPTARPTPPSSPSRPSTASPRSCGPSTPRTGTAPAPPRSSRPRTASRTAASSSCTTPTRTPSTPSRRSPPTSAPRACARG